MKRSSIAACAASASVPSRPHHVVTSTNCACSSAGATAAGSACRANARTRARERAARVEAAPRAAVELAPRARAAPHAERARARAQAGRERRALEAEPVEAEPPRQEGQPVDERDVRERGEHRYATFTASSGRTIWRATNQRSSSCAHVSGGASIESRPYTPASRATRPSTPGIAPRIAPIEAHSSATAGAIAAHAHSVVCSQSPASSPLRAPTACAVSVDIALPTPSMYRLVDRFMTAHAYADAASSSEPSWPTVAVAMNDAPLLHSRSTITCHAMPASVRTSARSFPPASPRLSRGVMRSSISLSSDDSVIARRRRTCRLASTDLYLPMRKLPRIRIFSIPGHWPKWAGVTAGGPAAQPEYAGFPIAPVSRGFRARPGDRG